MKKLDKTLGLILFVIPLLWASPIAWAQSGGILKGKVIDANGKFALPTVRITIIGAKKYGSTDSDGNFTISDISPGKYKVKFELAGYIDQTIKNVRITAGQVTELNVSMKMGFAHEVTVTASRAVEKLQEVPQNVEVVTSEELADTPIVNVLQSLENVTGVDLNSTAGNIVVGNVISIDGYDAAYIKQMVDGVEVSGVVESWTLTNTYPESMIDQIEVIKGGNSSVWGSNMGGIINYITKRPRDMARPKINIRGIFSHFGEWDYEDASAKPNPDGGNLKNYSANIMGSYQKFGYSFGIKHYSHDGFIDFGKENTNSFFGKIGYDFSDRTYLDVFYTYNKLKFKQHMFLEMFPGFNLYNWKIDSKSSTQVGYVKFVSNISRAIDLEAMIKYYRTDFEWVREFVDFGLTIPSQGFMERRIGFTIKSSYRPSLDFSLVGGMDYYRLKADFSDFIPGQPVISVNQYGPFINTEYNIVDSLRFHAGLRYDYDGSFGGQLSPSFGANFDLTDATLFRVNIARTFRIPPLYYTLGETLQGIHPNPDLNPERAWAYSAGFESQELRYVWVKISLYLHKMTDGIGVSANPDGNLMWDNLSKFTRKGYEAELGIITPFGLTTYVGTNYNHHEEERKEGNEVLIWIPTRSYKAGLKYKNEKLDLMANIRARWLWWNINDEFYKMLFDPNDKKWLINLRISKGFRITENVQLAFFVDVFNLLDKLYWDRKDQPSPRRWAQAGFELKLN
ncbi:MAG: TonB-dependent receptor [Candidatus Aminicenantes bacterium]|nr:TonB-dependent receptor [Candidatus Aminicenantes bacterium]